MVSTTTMGGKSGAGKKSTTLVVVREEDTKNDWGMIKEPESIDFDHLLIEEE